MFFVESVKMTDFVLSTSILALQSTELRFFVLWTVILAPESTESGIFALWNRYCTHRCRNIRDSAAQSRLRSSAQGLLCLLCALLYIGFFLQAPSKSVQAQPEGLHTLDGVVGGRLCRPRCPVKQLSIVLYIAREIFASNLTERYLKIIEMNYDTSRSTFGYFRPERLIKVSIRYP